MHKITNTRARRQGLRTTTIRSMREHQADRLMEIANGVTRTQMFRIFWSPSEGTAGGGDFFLRFGGSSIAFRAPTDSVWHPTLKFSGDVATDEFQPLTPYTAAKFWRANAQHGWCSVCQREYSRMSKHTDGSIHAKRCNEVVARAMKFTTPKGIKAINANGLDFFRSNRGRNTAKRRKAEKLRIDRLFFRYRPKTSECLAFSNPRVGLPNIATRAYAARTSLPVADAVDVLTYATGEWSRLERHTD